GSRRSGHRPPRSGVPSIFRFLFAMSSTFFRFLFATRPPAPSTASTVGLHLFLCSARGILKNPEAAFMPQKIGVSLFAALLTVAASKGWQVSSRTGAQGRKSAPPPAASAAPQSKHFPILLLAFGSDPNWSL